MKKSVLPLLLCAVMASPAVLAQDKDEHSAHHPQGQAGAPASAPKPTAETQSQPTQVEEGMRHLEQLMVQIDQSTDPSERESLLHEHMLGMLEQIKLLRSQAEGMQMGMMMMGGGKDGGGGQMGMMGGDKKKGSMKSGKQDKRDEMMGGGMMGSGMMGMHKMMTKRLDMIEQLLEQSIKHAHMREAAEH